MTISKPALLMGFFVVVVGATPLPAQRNDWKPSDFEPLTDLPWKRFEAPSPRATLDEIFRETNPAIRYPVLAAYLREIPPAQLEPGQTSST